MKKSFISLLALLILISAFTSGVRPALGQDVVPTATSAVILPEQGNVYTFSALGFKERVMVGPYDADRIFLSLPPDWALTTDASINLRLNYVGGFITDADYLGNWLGATLRVSFNNDVIDTILFDRSGELVKTINIPQEALAPVREDGRYLLSFFYDSSFNCNIKHTASSLIINSLSSINLAHELTPFVPDISKLPRPVFQPNSVVEEKAYIVVPDEPTVAELQSALAISAGWGSLTNGELKSFLIPMRELTTELKAGSSIIFVGLPSKLPILSEVSFPIPVSNEKLVWDGSVEEDGFIQMAVSPWNSSKAVLLVSGNSEAGVLKAGQALGAGNILPVGRADVAVISSVNPQTMDQDQIPEDRTFADLGYKNLPLGGVEGNYASFNFSASANQSSSTEAYLQLITSHSELLDFEKSGLTVYLNGYVIGGVQFVSQSDQVITTNLKLLPGIIRRGNNTIEIVADLIPIYNCFSPDLSSDTMIISDHSLIHLPPTTKEIDLSSYLNLQNFPSMFVSDRYLSDLAFVVPQDDSTAWDTAAKIAFNLGFKGGVPLANFQLAFGDSVSNEIRDGRNLIIIGRATDLPIIEELHDALPVPYEPGSDEAVQTTSLINYRLLPDVSVGYLQLFPSPWNPSLSILTVMGNNSQGIPMASEKLINDDLVSQLFGNFSILYGNQILSTDTRFGRSKDALVSNLPVAVPVTPETTAVPQSASPEPVIQGQAEWILPAIGVISAVIILIAFVMLINAIWKSAQLKKAKRTEIKSG